MPPSRRGAGALGGHRRPSSVRPSVRLMSRTSALPRKPKGLGRRNFAQGYPRSHETPTPTSRSKVKVTGWGILWRPPSRTACYSAAYTSQTRDQQRFTISEVAADWHELTVLHAFSCYASVAPEALCLCLVRRACFYPVCCPPRLCLIPNIFLLLRKNGFR